ncbi:MAG: gephyrin-like molybdotransferase Glp [Chloroflexota bacterium]
MISVEEALEKIMAKIDVLDEEEKPILESLGQVLACDVHSSLNVPPLDNAAMDGYAVLAKDTQGARAESPHILSVIDVVPAGSISQKEVVSGTAVRIMTGAPVPKGADAVIQFEHTDELERKGTAGNDKIGIMREVKQGLNIRRAAEDIARGDLVFRRGMVIRTAMVGMLASLGMGKARVIRRPVVAILATGDELVEIGEKLPSGKIYNSNTYSLASLVLRYGGIPKILGIGHDNEKELVEKINAAKAMNVDIVVSSGGVSMGDYDMVKNVLAREGEIDFWTVRTKPGKPLAFGTIRSTSKTGTPKNIPHFGLPGYPVSSMVTFELYVRPSILRMMGKKNLVKPTIEAIMEEKVVNHDGRRLHARAIVEKRDGKYYAHLTGEQGSGILTSMSLANGLVIVSEDRALVDVGETVKVMMLDWNEE